MKRTEIAPGAHLNEVPGSGFKRCKITLNLILPARRETATALAVLPHVLERRCAAIPDAMALSRRLFSLYGADLSGESYMAGANRVVSLGVSGLKNEYALQGEDLAGAYLALLTDLVFRPVVQGGAFAKEDVAIEKNKQADFLRSEVNDKRGRCLRQARRKLYGDSPLGIESAGYLEDMDALNEHTLYEAYTGLLRRARIEVMVCGADAAAVAESLQKELAAHDRAPVAQEGLPHAPVPGKLSYYEEPMDTAQGKLCILCTSPDEGDQRRDAVMRVASALLGGLPTSRLFLNVREKQSLCYYCASIWNYYGGVLSIDSGVDHVNAKRASDAILKELERMQKEPVTEEEMGNARRALQSVFDSAKDSPDALVAWAFNERLRGTDLSLDEALAILHSVSAEEVQKALAGFKPAVEYVITQKEGA